MEPTVRRRFEVARELAATAGELALASFRRPGLVAVPKGPVDWVTEVDVAVEHLIRSRLAEEFPADGFLGEEEGRLGGDDESYLWVVDPIDGTVCYASGVAQWAVSIACLDPYGHPALGVVCDPVGGETFAAVAGGRLLVDDSELEVPRRGLRDGLVGVGYAPKSGAGARTLRFLDALVGAGAGFVTPGSAALALAYVAAGRLVGFFEASLRIWDCLAGEVLVRAGGGWVTSFVADGRLDGDKEMLAANAASAAELRALWQATGPGPTFT